MEKKQIHLSQNLPPSLSALKHSEKTGFAFMVSLVQYQKRQGSRTELLWNPLLGNLVAQAEDESVGLVSGLKLHCKQGWFRHEPEKCGFNS